METIEQTVVNVSGNKVGSVNLDPAVFGTKVLTDLLHQTVRWQRAKKRAGTHSALTRSNMKGGGKKPFKQKGTGNARAGSNISPLWVGGASVHGPTPRKYEFSLTRKVKQRALKSALSQKQNANAIIVLDDLAIDSGKSKDAASVLNGLGIYNKKIVAVVATDAEQKDLLVMRATKNLAGVTTVPVKGLNVYDLVNAEVLLIGKNTLDLLAERFAK